MNRENFSPEGQRFIDLYEPLVQDIIRAFTEISFNHDKVAYSLLIKAFTDSAVHARQYMDAIDAQFDNAIEC